jgi:hypothetical protein
MTYKKMELGIAIIGKPETEAFMVSIWGWNSSSGTKILAT